MYVLLEICLKMQMRNSIWGIEWSRDPERSRLWPKYI